MRYLSRKHPRDRIKRQTTIENVVASAAIQHTIDLDAVVRAFPAVKYQPERFPGIVFRLHRPKTTLLLFRSGKIVCTGAKSESLAMQAIHQLIHRLQQENIVGPVEPVITIQNVVASASLGGKIDLERAAFMQDRAMYEPEQFPGVIYQIRTPRAVILLFASGKLVCTGAKREADVLPIIKSLHDTLDRAALIYNPSAQRHQ